MAPKGRRVSVWHWLVAIALLPALGLPVLAGQLVVERLQEASTATRVERDLEAVQALDGLRSALNNEVIAGSLTLVAGQLGLPTPMLSGQLGLQAGSAAEAVAATDRALADVPRIPPLVARLSGVAQQLRGLRVAMDSAIGAPGRGLDSLTAITVGYAQLGDQVSDAERFVAHLVASGGEGVISARLLAAAHELEPISAVVISGGNRAGLFFIDLLAPAQLRAKVGSQLKAEDQAYRSVSANLEPDLTERSAQAWDRLARDSQFRTFDAAVSGRQAPAPDLSGVASGSGFDLAGLAAVLPVAQAGAHVLTELSGFLDQAVTQAAETARADAAEARHHAAVSLVVTGILLTGTTAALLVIGGMLRGRLHQLAVGAQRLSAGHLDPVPVQGPRELAATSEAINDAVASLRHVEAKAELLAGGDLDSAELERPAPGPLGAAVHASVSRIVTAVREREELQALLAHQASHDSLTGLPNRAELDRALAAALGRAQRGGMSVSVLFIDLDGFKACNDRLGHAAGDHVLREVAARMRSAVRVGDIVGRLGGDEFVVIVEDAGSVPEVVELGERIVAGLTEPIQYEGQHVQVGASVGLSSCEAGHTTCDQLMSEADSAVYRAKAAGGGVVVTYDQAFRGRMQAQRELESGVAQALQRDEFALHYQPVIDLAAARLCGFEALIRWERPGVGLVPPAEFIPAVEGGDLIVEIGRWVLLEATRQLVEWSDHPALQKLTVSVNLSGWHLLNPCVVDDVRAALEVSGLVPSRLVIEITETLPVDSVQAVEHLRQLSAMGVRIALDDFGTGHTSINQLLNPPIDVLKLDRSLINDLSPTSRTTRGPRPIADLMIEMARSLNLTVVAEGVEQAEQLADLTNNHCDQAQGFFFSHPLPPTQVQAWVVQRMQEDQLQRGATGS